MADKHDSEDRHGTTYVDDPAKVVEGDSDHPWLENTRLVAVDKDKFSSDGGHSSPGRRRRLVRPAILLSVLLGCVLLLYVRSGWTAVAGSFLGALIGVGVLIFADTVDAVLRGGGF